jgi:pilus assembly protein CpaF
MEDPEVTDILVNGLGPLYLETKGRLISFPCPFQTPQQLGDFVERLVVPIGKRLDAARPYLDGRLLDGSRFNIVAPPIAPEGPLISIRKSSRHRGIGLGNFEWFGHEEWVRTCILERKNLLVCGSTGSGKTTLLSCLLEIVPHTERLAIIEETRELYPRHPHVISLEARPASPEGKGEVSLRALIRNSLRMRPDRVVLGECRGSEAIELLQAMNTGHSGSLCTLHANSALDGLKRLEMLILLSGMTSEVRSVRDWISGVISGVLFLERAKEGRRVAEIIEVLGLEGPNYRYRPVLSRSG